MKYNYRVVEMMNDMFYIEYQLKFGKWFPVDSCKFGWSDVDEAIKQMNILVERDKETQARNTLKRIVEKSYE